MRLYELGAYSDDVLARAEDAIDDYTDERRGQLALQWLSDACPLNIQDAFNTWLMKWECAQIQQELDSSVYTDDLL